MCVCLYTNIVFIMVLVHFCHIGKKKTKYRFTKLLPNANTLPTQPKNTSFLNDLQN